MEFRVLGPLHALDAAGHEVRFASEAQRRLVSFLVQRANTVVPGPVLEEHLRLTPGAVRTSVSRLRRWIDRDTLISAPGGYELRTDDVDAGRFERLLATARSSDDSVARAVLTEAVGLWRGDAYADVAGEEWAVAESTRLNERRASAVEELAELRIEAGEAASVIGMLESLIDVHPYRDRPRALLMRALADMGRRTDALRAFQAYRQLLGDEVGTEPSPFLVTLDRAIAAQTENEVSLRLSLPANPAWRRERQVALPVGTVSFLLTDIAESTALWAHEPDAMAEAVARHHAILDDSVAAHGGVRPEEQGEGDSIVAVFTRVGDAIAAARDAQIAMQREAWPTSKPINVRMGVHTGDARLRGNQNYVGLTIIKAARLRNLAHGGQVLLSSATHDSALGRVEDGILMLDLGEHRLKGIADPERVYQLLHRGLRADFDALPYSTPTNVPAPLATFIGREKELAALEDLLTGERLVTITGSGGVGKTSLAMQTATNLLEHFADGVWWVELAPLTEDDQVAGALADVLHVRVDEDAVVTDAIVRTLADDHALVVLDNCEHLTAAAAELAVLVLQRCPNASVLATSRGVLGILGETTWRVPALSFPPADAQESSAPSEDFDAVRLFVDRARRVRAGFALTNENRTAVAEICQRLDGIPLAIELASARAKSLTVDQIRDGLEHALPLLRGGTRSAPPRQQTLEASIAWSVALLDDRDRALLHRLSVFNGSFDLAAVEAICGDGRPAIEVLDSLERLIDHSLVLALDDDRAGRFMQLETVRQYGAAQLDQHADSARYRRRHADHFRELAHEIAPHLETDEEVSAVERFEADIDNFRSALVWYRDGDDAGTFAAFACDLAVYWNLAGATVESRTWLTYALDALGDMPSVERARLLAHRGTVHSNMGSYSAAIKDLRAAIAEGKEVGDLWSVGRGYWTLAELAAYVDLDAWRPLSERSIEALTASGDQFALAYARLWRGVAYLMRGHQPEGIERLLAAGPTVAALNNPTVNASHKIWHGWAALQSGDVRRTGELAAEVMNGPGFRLPTQRLFGELLLAASACHRGIDSPLLREFTTRSETALRRGEGLTGVMYQYWESFCLLFSDTAAALERSRYVVAHYSESHPSVACAAHLVAALAAYGRGELEAAESHADAAEGLEVPMKWPMNRTRLFLVRSLLTLAHGDLVGANARIADAIALARDEGLGVDLVYALEVQALIAVAGDDFTQAAQVLGIASAMRDQVELRGELLPLAVPVRAATERARAALGDESYERALAEGAVVAGVG